MMLELAGYPAGDVVICRERNERKSSVLGFIRIEHDRQR